MNQGKKSILDILSFEAKDIKTQGDSFKFMLSSHCRAICYEHID